MPFDTLALTDLPELSDLLLISGKVRLRIASGSMAPTLQPGDEIVVRPVPLEQIWVGDLILFTHQGQLVCHRLVEMSAGAMLTRGDAASSAGERIARDQVLGKVVRIRKRTVWVGLKASLQRVLVPLLLRWLPRLQRVRAYRLLLRPFVAPFLSYHLGLAQGARWYEWQELPKDNGFPLLPRSVRPHLLLAKRGKDVVGWSVLILRNSEWQCEDLHVRLRYRGLGVGSDLARLSRFLVRAQ